MEDLKQRMQELLHKVNEYSAIRVMSDEQVKALSELKEKLEAAVKVF